MRLKKIQEALKTKNIIFTYTEEDNCGSLDFSVPWTAVSYLGICGR